MGKKGPISKIEAFYIQENYRDMAVADLAADLDRTISSIEKYITKNLSKPRQTGVTAGDQIHHHKGATVMTENASTISDERRKSVIRKPSNCVTKIKREK